MEEESDQQLYNLFVNSFQDNNEAFLEEDDVNDPEYDFLKDLESIELEEDFKVLFDNNDFVAQLSIDIADQTVDPEEQFTIEQLVELHYQIRSHTQLLTQTWMLTVEDNQELASKAKDLLEKFQSQLFFKFGLQSSESSTRETRVFCSDIGSDALKVIENEEKFLKAKPEISQRSQNSTLLFPHYREVLLRHPSVFYFDWALPCHRPNSLPSNAKRQITAAEDYLIASYFKQQSSRPGGKVNASKITEANLIQLKEHLVSDLSTKTLSLHFKRYRSISRQIQTCDNLESDLRLKKFSFNPLIRYFLTLPPVKTNSIFNSPTEFGLKPPKWYPSSSSSSRTSNIFPLYDSTNVPPKRPAEKFILPKGAEIYSYGQEKIVVLPEEAISTPAPQKMSRRSAKNVSFVEHLNISPINESITPLPEMNENDDFEDFEMENNPCDMIEDLDETQQSTSSNDSVNNNHNQNDNEETDDPNDLLALMQASWTPVHRRPEGPSGVNLKSKAEIKKHTKLFYTHLSKNFNNLSWAERRNMDSYIKFHVHRMKTILTANEFEKFVHLINRSVDENALQEYYCEIQTFFRKVFKHHSYSPKKTRELKIYSKLFILFFNFDQSHKLNKSFRQVHLSRMMDFMSKVLVYIHYCYPKQEQRMLYMKRFASIMFKLSVSDEDFAQKLGRLKSVLKKMFKGNTLLLQEFRGLLLNESPPEYLMSKNSDFEHVDIGKISEFNSVNICPESDSRFGTKNCQCKCHSNLETLPSTTDESDLQHCVSCSIRMVSNRIFLPSSSATGKRNQYVEYTVEKRPVHAEEKQGIDNEEHENQHGEKSGEEKPWTLEENRTLMLTCRQYMLDNDIKEYSDDLYDIVAAQIKDTSNIDRDVQQISSRLVKLLDSFEKYFSKT